MNENRVQGTPNRVHSTPNRVQGTPNRVHSTPVNATIPPLQGATARLNRGLERWPWATLDGEPLERIAHPDLGTWRVVVPAGEGRVPGPFESDLWVALHVFWRDAGSPSDGRVILSMRDLLTLMRRPRGGRQYTLVREGLERILGVTIYGVPEKEIVAKGEAHRGVADRGFHLLDNYDARDPARMYVRLNEAACAAMNEFGRNLDAAFYFSLERPASRRLYRYIEYRSYRPGRVQSLTIPLHELAVELPLRPVDAPNRKKNLRPAHAELANRGYLSSIAYAKQGRAWLVVYELSSPTSVPPVLAPTTATAAGDDRVRKRVHELLVLLRDERSTAFYLDVARRLPDAVYDHLVGAVREGLRNGDTLDTARKIFTHTAKRRLVETGAGVP